MLKRQVVDYRILLLALLLLGTPARGQNEPAPSGTRESEAEEPAPVAETPKVDAELQLKLASPQACLATFFRAFEEKNLTGAATCLDLSGLAAPDVASAKREEYAYKLKRILDAVIIQVEWLPSETDYDGICLFSEFARDPLTGFPLADRERADFEQIAIVKSETDGLWRFAAGTTLAIDEIHERWEADSALRESSDPMPFSVWLEQQVPPSLTETHFLIPDYMWIALLVVVTLGFVADFLVGSLAVYLSHVWFKISSTQRKDEAIRGVMRPAGLLVQALVWYFGTRAIGLPDAVLAYLLIGLKFFTVFAGVWVFLRLIDSLGDYFSDRASRTASRFDDLLVPLMTTSLKVFATLIGALICAEAFDLPIKGLLGGLGLVGMALALASQDAISNLFGSFTVLIDRPFEIGDWVITEDIEGTVEAVGFRSTRIRTFYNSLITLPNSRFTTAVVDNMGRRRYRRVKSTIGVQYDTSPEQLDAFCEGVRELIRKHPNTRKDYFHVYFNNFSESSLDILLYFFLRVPDWSSELRERHRLFVDIIRLAQRLGISFAFPTRTLHVDPASPEPFPGGFPNQDVDAFGKATANEIVNARRAG